ncbi:MAG: diguanylate cyclase [Gammaproteobacteria bacterium]
MAVLLGALIAPGALAADGSQGSLGSALSGVGHPAFGALMVMAVMALLIASFWRELKLFLLAGLAASSLAALLFADGLRWTWSGLAVSGVASPAALFFICLALFFGLRYTRALLDTLSSRSVLSHSGRAVEGGLIALCVLCVLVTETLAPTAVRIVAAVSFATLVVALLLSASRVKQTRRRPAFIMHFAWLFLALALIAIHVSEPASFIDVHGLKSAVAIAVFLLALAFVDQQVTLGQRLDLRLAADGRNAALLRVERSRRDFAEDVAQLVDQLDPELYEESIMQRFLEYLSNMLPVAAAAVAVSHRGEVRLVVSARSMVREEFESILATREELLQSVCLSDRAAVIHSDDLGVSAAPESASCLGIVPVRARRNEWAGVLLARSGDLEFGLDELDLVSDFAHQAYEAIISAQKFRKVKRQAETDPLTGILNRRAVMARGRRAFRKHRSLGEPLAILFIDIDHFKQVNDKFGHDAGDAALKVVAEVCGDCLREDDFIGRFGGEEFLAVLPGASAKEAELVAERLRVVIEEAQIEYEGQTVRITVSVGIAELTDKFADLDTMLRAADRALYRAKREGRNRVIHHRYMLRGDRVRRHL